MKVRLPVFADDRWYPSTEARLNAEIDRYMGSNQSVIDAIAVVAPHAGYYYSGHVSGAVYSQVSVPERVIVVAPNHRGLGARRAIMARGAWRIPGRDIPIDHNAARTLMAHMPSLIDDSLAHSQEHSLEVQLPFLNRRNPDFQLVPICLFPQSQSDCRDLGKALAAAVTELPGRTLIVASTDMNHFESATIGNRKDRKAISQVVALEPESLYSTVVSEDISMCGVVPTTIVMHAALALGANAARLVKYADSGDVNQDKSSVVGYAGLVLTQ